MADKNCTRHDVMMCQDWFSAMLCTKILSHHSIFMFSKIDHLRSLVNNNMYNPRLQNLNKQDFVKGDSFFGYFVTECNTLIM